MGFISPGSAEILDYKLGLYECEVNINHNVHLSFHFPVKPKRDRPLKAKGQIAVDLQNWYLKEVVYI